MPTPGVSAIGIDIPVKSDADSFRYPDVHQDRKSTRLNSSHVEISYAGFCLKKKIFQIRATFRSDRGSKWEREFTVAREREDRNGTRMTGKKSIGRNFSTIYLIHSHAAVRYA